MNKAELIDAVAKTGNMKKKDAEAAICAVTSAIVSAMKNGEKVQIVGFGTFDVKTRGARVGRNPKTGASIQVPVTRHPSFSASKALKDALK